MEKRESKGKTQALNKQVQELGKKMIEFYQSHRKLTIIGGGILAVLLIAAIVLPILGKNDDEVAMQTAQVTIGDLTKTIDVVGTVKAVPSSILSFGTEGIVSDYDLQVADQVLEGDVLIMLKDSSISSSILQAESSLLDAQHELDKLINANSLLYEAALTLEDAEYAYRSKLDSWEYWNFNNTPQNAVDEAVESYIAKENTLTRAKDVYNTLSRQVENSDDPELAAAHKEMQAAQFERDKALRHVNYLLGHTFDHAVETDYIEYKQADAALQEALLTYEKYFDNSDEIAAAQANVQALQNTIDSAKIIAPFDGTVTNIMVDPGQLISSGTAAVQVDALDNLMIHVLVSEVDIEDVEVGQEAIVTLDALPNRQYSGIVVKVSQAGSDESGVVEFSVSVNVIDPAPAIKPGFTAVASITIDQVENALLVPSSALQSREGRNVVMKVDDQVNITPIQVEVGVSAESYTEILSDNLAEGDTIMVFSTTSDSQFFFPGPGGGFGLGGLGGERPKN
ncbi:MAG TPA: efflux RND transporter periplasmic adaptor subunit [Anaerolineae bacterium]|nr:efflux RND transporter periplasmic adaptor subunit [Anaerolineae bacterium]